LLETSVELWTDGEICLVSWGTGAPFQSLLLDTRGWYEFGIVWLGGNPIVVDKWLEFRFNGKPQWRLEVSPAVLEQREREKEGVRSSETWVTNNHHRKTSEVESI
jgi:hypothetical protein